LSQPLPVVQIIVPCYNPQSGWHQVLAERFLDLRTHMANQCHLQLLLVNDGSTLGISTEYIAYLKQATELVYLSYDLNRGKGAALRAGVLASTAPLLLVTDIDFPYTQESMQTVLHALIEHGGIVSGHREESYYARVPWFRTMLSKSFRLLLRYFMRLPVTDSQCGLKGMDQSGKTLFLQTKIDRYLYDLEFMQLANKRVSVRVVPVELREGITFTSMGLGILKTEFGNFIRLLLRRS
jgi:glycosyltransferase involved in cell wall biosynthesis